MSKEEKTFEWVENTTLSKKPIPDKNGKITYRETLTYLVRVIEQDAPYFDLVLGLASFATNNCLSERQAEKANEIIRYFHKKGVI